MLAFAAFRLSPSKGNEIVNERSGSASSPTRLPKVDQLRGLYDEYRELYFRSGDGWLIPQSRDVRIEWSTRLTSSAGVCYPKLRLIRLSTHYHARFPEDVGATLLHEMIHLVVPGHGPRFQAWIDRITAAGGKVTRYSKAVAAPPRWVYVCGGCGKEIHRQRRLPKGGRSHCCSACGPKKGRLTERPAGVG